MSTQSYDLGWNDCRKREVQPLTEENARFRAVNGQLLLAAQEGLAALERVANGGLAYKITRNQLRAAIAEAQKATGGQP